MRVGVTGATGLIGEALCRALIRDGNQLTVFSRSREKAKSKYPAAEVVEWQSSSGPPPQSSLEGLDALVNLAGASIAGRRWSEERKRAIRESRVKGTRFLVEALSRCKAKPRVLVNGSAVGYYGSRGDEVLDENSRSGSDFLAEVCRDWEAEALKARDLGIRVALLRTGIVLSTEGGALPRMLPPFKMFIGGPLGSGRQWMSWIHLVDEMELIRYAIHNETFEGPVNATAPRPVTNREFSRTLGKVLHRPASLPVPAFALKLLVGEMAEPLLLHGQKVIPAKAESHGFQFQFRDLKAALSNLLG